MKSITKFTALFTFSLFTFLTSCTEEDIIDELTGDCISFNEIEAYSVALENFNNDPSTENCVAYTQAAISYLDSLNNCPFIDDADLQEVLQEASETGCED